MRVLHKMKETALYFAIFGIQLAVAQNRAPSCWLHYQDNFPGDIIVNKIRVKSPSPLYTYYCSLQWNAGMEGGGYCGIQEHPNGRNFIFSIWDPINSQDSILAEYTHSGTQVQSFGGEGTGLKSWNFSIGWETDQWYSFVSRAWPSDSNTMFGFWVFNHTDDQWHHLVTMKYPVRNVLFNSSTGSFIEDWLGNGWSQREVHHQNGWKRKTIDLSWNAFTSSFFERVIPDSGAINYINNFDGGTNIDHYFMQSGGIVTPLNNASGTMLSLANNNQNPGYDVGEVLSLSKVVSLDSLMLNWVVDSSKAPQFSYNISIFDNPTLLGSPLIQYNEIKPHQRNLNIDISSLLNGTDYYVSLNIIDVFDNQSTTITEHFIAQSTNLEIKSKTDKYTYNVYPNPFDDRIHLKVNNTKQLLSIDLIDISGKPIFTQRRNNFSFIEIETPSELEKGIYFLIIADEKKIKHVVKLEKK